MSRREEFQGKCLLNGAGHLYMGIYDNFPVSIRNRLKYSPFNLCAACINELTNSRDRDVWALNATIDRMEEQVRREELRREPLPKPRS